jgi:hypothetical protein
VLKDRGHACGEDQFRDVVAGRMQEESWGYEGVPGHYVDVARNINFVVVDWVSRKPVCLLSFLCVLLGLLKCVLVG